MSWIEIVRDTLKRQLTGPLQGEVIYTMQQLNYSKPEQVYEILKPLAPDFAAWFKNIAIKNESPGSAIDDLNWVYRYTDLWPEVIEAIDECKTVILKHLLQGIKEGHYDTVKRRVRNLQSFGVTWPELSIMTGSLMESESNEDLREEGRQMLVQILMKKINETESGIYFAMYHLDDWNLDLRMFPEISKVIDDRKTFIMRNMLVPLADQTRSKEDAISSALFNVTRMKKIGVEWPELDVIKDSLTKDLDEGRGESPQTVIMRNFRYGAIHGLRYMVMYDKNIADIPEANAALEDRKEFLIRRMLNLFKQEDFESLEEVLSLLKAVGVDWSELSIIDDTLRAVTRSEIDEADDEREHDGEDFEYDRAWRAKLEYQEFLKDLRHDIETQTWDLVALDLIDIGMTEVEDVLPTRTKQLIEQNKHGIIRGILERMKVSRYTEMTIHAVVGLNNMGFNWPELEIIRDSLEDDSKDRT